MEKSSVMLSQKTNVIILAGFLGAGKTTLLKRILSWENDLSGTVVIVNEFGDVGIDGSLLKNAGSNSDMVELTSGCVCCSLKMDLSLTLKRIRKKLNPSRIFIEATGVADPLAIMEVFQDLELRQYMNVDKIITVLDADFWEVREGFGSLFFSQLCEADLILLNKIDTVDDNYIPTILKEMHEAFPNSKIIPTIRCEVDPESLWRVGRRNDSSSEPNQFFKILIPDSITEEKSHFTSFSFTNSIPLDENCFKQFTQKLPWEIFRMKGPVSFQDRTVLVNYAGGKCEWTEWSGTEETRLAFVGLKVSGDETIRQLKKCIAGS